MRGGSGGFNGSIGVTSNAFRSRKTGPVRRIDKEKTVTLLIYLVGWIILIGGVAWGLMAMHVAQHTIAIVAVIMLGVAVITGATRVRNRDRS
jgi:uncharacterized membrane protein YoaK (UPF0700 family)